jgi:histidinol-phosphate aminotransferase
VKYPYNVNAPTQLEVMRRIDEGVAPQVREICQQRSMLLAAFAELSIVERVFPTDANFVLIRVADPNAVYDYLVSRGVIVRNRTRLRGCEGCLRITIGTPAENERVVNLLREISK